MALHPRAERREAASCLSSPVRASWAETIPPLSKVNVRFHYAANGSAGGWSGTKPVASSGVVNIGPQAMEGNLVIAARDTLRTGYDFTMPGPHADTKIAFALTTV